jgi:hypothetical protein
MITIDRDYNTPNDRYKVRAYDHGFGHWTKRGLSLDAALLCVSHYYAVNGHRDQFANQCPVCKEPLKVRRSRR